MDVQSNAQPLSYLPTLLTTDSNFHLLGSHMSSPAAVTAMECLSFSLLVHRKLMTAPEAGDGPSDKLRTSWYCPFKIHIGRVSSNAFRISGHAIPTKMSSSFQCSKNEIFWKGTQQRSSTWHSYPWPSTFTCPQSYILRPWGHFNHDKVEWLHRCHLMT